LAESKKTTVKKIAKGNQLDFLYDLYTRGINIGDKSVQQLREAGYIEDDYVPPVRVPDPKEEDGKAGSFQVRTDAHKAADSVIDIIEGSADLQKVISKNDWTLRSAGDDFVFSGKTIGVDIQKKDWVPEVTFRDHSPEFVAFIDSLLFSGFHNRTKYKPLSLYVRQAQMWLDLNDQRSNFYEDADIEAFEDREIDRCRENSLYAMNRHLKLKQGAMDTGSRLYIATPAHEIMCFLFDCGYSFMMGKPRQIAATSTIGGLAMMRLIFNRNYFIKFITESDEKGQEIFEDKIKYPNAELPDYIRPDVKNDSAGLLAYGTKEKKGDRDGVNSKLQVVAPSRTAISGGSPDLVLIDEIGNIKILSSIIEDGRPTMFWVDPKTGKMAMKRQVCAWGTGGDTERGGKAFEREFMALVSMWKNRDFSSGLIPIFFDWRSRPGISQEIYDREKRVYYAKTGPDAEASRVMFHQQYPDKIEDMFLTSAKTLVSQEYINESIDRIRKTKSLLKTKRGYFIPILGDKPQHEGADLPFNIIGAEFVPVEEGDPRATTTMIMEPKLGWKHRYYQGTDPISSDTGMSNMATAVWDKHYNTVSCVVDWRSPNYKSVFLQCMLMGLYYDTEKKKGIKELLETNIGLAYREYKDNKGAYDSMVLNTELPRYLQVNTGNLIGIDNRGNRNRMIIDKLFELIQAFGNKIYFEDFFQQLKTFVCTTNQRGNESWGPADRRYYKDDTLFAIVYSYICAISFPHEIPHKIEEEKKKSVVRHELVYDKDFNLSRRPVRIRR
jgi:hypothetical protein